MRSQLSDEEKLYTDIIGLRAHDNLISTVPINLIATTRPDMVCVRGDRVVLIELTIPFNSLGSGRSRKQNKGLYQK